MGAIVSILLELMNVLSGVFYFLLNHIIVFIEDGRFRPR